jgi:thioredoxin-related protein
MMETDTFLKAEVQDVVNGSFVSLKFESGKDAEQFLRFGIKATPTYIFLDREGNELHRVIGFYSAGDFIRVLREVPTLKTEH